MGGTSRDPRTNGKGESKLKSRIHLSLLLVCRWSVTSCFVQLISLLPVLHRLHLCTVGPKKPFAPLIAFVRSFITTTRKVSEPEDWYQGCGLCCDEPDHVIPTAFEALWEEGRRIWSSVKIPEFLELCKLSSVGQACGSLES